MNYQPEMMKTLRYPFSFVTSAIALTIGGCAIPELNFNPSPTPTSTPLTVVQPTTSAIATNTATSKKPTPTGFKKVTVVQNLERPWGMAWLPDGAMLITERVGRVQILRNGSLQQVAIAEIPNLFVSGQAGLMDI